MARMLEASSGWTLKRLFGLYTGVLALVSLAYLSYFYLSSDIQKWHYHSAFPGEAETVILISQSLTDTRIERFGREGEELATVIIPDHIPQGSYVALASFGDTLVFCLEKSLSRPSETPSTRLFAINTRNNEIIWDRNEPNVGLPFGAAFRVGDKLITLLLHKPSRGGLQKDGYSIVESRDIVTGDVQWAETADGVGLGITDLGYLSVFLHQGVMYLWTIDGHLMCLQPEEENKILPFRRTRHTTLTDEAMIFLHSDSIYRYSLDGNQAIDSFPLPPSSIDGYYFAHPYWTCDDTILLGFQGHKGDLTNSLVLILRDSILTEFNDSTVRKLLPMQHITAGLKSIVEFPGDHLLVDLTGWCLSKDPLCHSDMDKQLALLDKKNLDVLWRSDYFCSSNIYSIAQGFKWNILYLEPEPYCPDTNPKLLFFDQPSGKLVDAVFIPKPGLIYSLCVMDEDRLYIGNKNSYVCLSLPDIELIWQIGKPFPIESCLEEIVEKMQIPGEWVLQ